MTVDPNMSYVDFAKGVAQVLIDEYGTHNYEPFIKELKKSFNRMVADLKAETQDMIKLAEENPNDMVLFNISEELKDLFNRFRTHVRKKYKDE